VRYFFSFFCYSLLPNQDLSLNDVIWESVHRLETLDSSSARVIGGKVAHHVTSENKNNLIFKLKEKRINGQFSGAGER
jgi:hypothetical protein